MKLQFPHISRLFSARPILVGGKILLWIMFTALVGSNLFFSLSDTRPLGTIITHPFSVSAHLSFAQLLRDQGAQDLATQELLLASELFHGSENVLGAQANPDTLLTTWKNEPKHIKKTTESWNKLVEEHPDYRDGYLMIAYNTYLLGQLTDTKEALSRAQTLDPNNSTIKQLLTFINRK